MDNVRAKIQAQCEDIEAMLLEKNAAYGNSALEPVRVFSQADPVEQIRVRLDDKLSRLARGSAAGEDVLMDLIGYLVLLKIAEEGTEAQGHKGTEEEEAEVVHKVDLDDLCVCGHARRLHTWDIEVPAARGRCVSQGCKCEKFKLA